MYNVDKKILENLNNDEILSLLKSIRYNYTYYDDYIMCPYPYKKIEFSGVNQGDDIRISLYSPIDEEKKDWVWVNSIIYGEYKEKFYKKYTEIVRMRKLNTLELNG